MTRAKIQRIFAPVAIDQSRRNLETQRTAAVFALGRGARVRLSGRSTQKLGDETKGTVRGRKKGGRGKTGTWKMSVRYLARILHEFRLRFPPLTGHRAEMKTLFTACSLITRSIVVPNCLGLSFERKGIVEHFIHPDLINLCSKAKSFEIDPCDLLKGTIKIRLYEQETLTIDAIWRSKVRRNWRYNES